MKKITALLLALMMAPSLCACGNKGGGSNNGGGTGGTMAVEITPVPCKISVHDFFITSLDDKPYIVLYLDITNEADKSLETNNLASPVLYQGGTQVADLHDDCSWMEHQMKQPKRMGQMG